MKHNKIIATLLITFLGFGKMAGQSSDAIIGVWLTKEKDSKIEIYKSNNKYYGKILWINDNIDPETGKPYVDKYNPDKKKRNVGLIGLVILKDLVYMADDKKWDDGEIYDPNNGNTYSSYLSIDGANSLKLRGYLGFSLLGRTEIWTRVN